MINKDGGCFTGGQYNILRVIAAYPLNAKFDSTSKHIKSVLGKDQHPLATLRHVPLLASLATDSETCTILSSLQKSLKRQRTDGDVEDEDGQPDAKSRKIPANTNA